MEIDFACWLAFEVRGNRDGFENFCPVLELEMVKGEATFAEEVIRDCVFVIDQHLQISFMDLLVERKGFVVDHVFACPRHMTIRHTARG